MAKTKSAPKPPQEQAPCPIDRDAFLKEAKPILVEVNGQKMAATVKQFSTGSFGWYLSGKIVVEVGGTHLPVTIGANFFVVGSKPNGEPKAE